ncbi:MAG TPA: plastocyanin/azurin family copper-binding protein [Bryobacteraceae bacterium]|nr:plastocyanin/azurin family copper-binding protein [Bryobacteraceae bacterium]
MLSRLNICLAILAVGASLALAADHQIIQKDRSFSQTEITIKPGDKIVFQNSDDVTHNVFSITSGMEFDLRRQAPGASSTVPFDKEGVAEVRCSIHPKMKLIVTVKK